MSTTPTTPSTTTTATTTTSAPSCSMARDLSSLSNPNECKVTHLDWQINVDFDTETLVATATYTFQRIDPNATTLCLDTNHLKIISVDDASNNKPLRYTLHPLKDNSMPHLGRCLEIHLSSSSSSSGGGATPKVAITYATTPACSALQWLTPEQTTGRQHPYLFTQCQAIHARSLLPCQDMPGVKMTYTAVVTVPAWAVCVMSGVQKQETTTAKAEEEESKKQYTWEQAVPISSYLIALAVGDLVKKDLSMRCAIWSEPALIDAAAYEFAQTEDFLQAAEDIAGTPYVWGRYDLLCLPPSFPYGGMENPCLTFVTPTLLAGDRSLADVVAHEIAHSWTGNLVTNSTWDHFWLNEGWTTWFQRKIMVRIHQDDRFLDFDAIGGYKSLQDCVNSEMPAQFTQLVLPIGNLDPDDAYSIVAYEKGFNLLLALERRVGKDAFEDFFKAYVANFANKTVDSEQFRAFFVERFQGNESIQDFDWQTWFYAPGMPPETPQFDRSLAEASEHLADCWLAVDRNGRMIPSVDTSKWSSNQMTCFLDALQTRTASQPLKLETIHSMNRVYGFASSNNAEILFRYCQLAVASEDETILLVLCRFITGQGRMKYVRPLYRALYHSKMAKQLAVDLFLHNKDFYHPICVKMIASDLHVADSQQQQNTAARKWGIAMTVLTVAVAAVGFVVFRKRR